MSRYIEIPEVNLKKVSSSIHTTSIVGGYTHCFYRYPARFSPIFCSAMIQAFTEPGDVILDPFMGGGTTLVESMIHGRRAFGTDISSLSKFISEVKTSTISPYQINSLNSWSENLPMRLNLKNECRLNELLSEEYSKNINTKEMWRIRKLIGLTLDYINDLPRGKQRNVARCALLRTSQWALDCKTRIVSVGVFRTRLINDFKEVINGLEQFSNRVRDVHSNYNLIPSVNCLKLPASKLKPKHLNNNAPRLILTSPPYPGVHVLYHRWQVHGRRETPIPFGIANCVDGDGASHYTFGDRKNPDLYFGHMRNNFKAIYDISDEATTIVQLVSFSNPIQQLNQYLRCLEEVGFKEYLLPELANSSDGRIRRRVPNRKWYADYKGNIDSSKELVLFHRKS